MLQDASWLLRCTLCLLSICFVCDAHAQVLRDTNGDSLVTVLFFGDSITYGIGDQDLPLRPPDEEESPLISEELDSADLGALRAGEGGAGYPLRVGSLLGVSIINEGVPGEVFSTDGMARFPAVVQRSSADVVTILGGANDAILRFTAGTFERALQRVINVARTLGKEVVILTPIPPCCDHDSMRPFTDTYGGVARDLADINRTILADTDRGWLTRCPPGSQCLFYNLPEGLHPNPKGYDLMSQAVAAALLEIDAFTPSGLQDLAAALGLSAEAMLIRPDTMEVGSAVSQGGPVS